MEINRFNKGQNHRIYRRDLNKMCSPLPAARICIWSIALMGTMLAIGCSYENAGTPTKTVSTEVHAVTNRVVTSQQIREYIGSYLPFLHKNGFTGVAMKPLDTNGTIRVLVLGTVVTEDEKFILEGMLRNKSLNPDLPAEMIFAIQVNDRSGAAQ